MHATKSASKLKKTILCILQAIASKKLWAYPQQLLLFKFLNNIR